MAADARLIETDNLSIDKSALTGESIAVSKNTETLIGQKISLGERSNMVYKGTFVTAGKGKAVVVATGKFTEMGKIQGMVSQAESSQTPLQRQLDEVGSQLVLLCSGVCGFTFGLGLLRGYSFLPMLKTAISLAVASVPEGLPTIATTTLALGMHDMRKRHILIRRNIMTTVHKTEGEQILVAVKGSPEELIKICTRVSKNGEVVRLTQQDKQALELENERMAGKALRVLGVAYAYVDNGNENPEHDLIWLGLTGMADPIRQGIAELMAQFHQAGIDTVMITGDQSPTAYAIAKKLNLSGNHKLEILDSS
ncbi:MAG: HAD family hydrolase, partial [Richelia sp. SM2_1_7]|nr:HAD family hydrolase [Richelia sp. SM2_1_7]